MAASFRAKSHFELLPVEIHTYILTELIPSKDALHSLLTTCKSIYELALPYSVHTFRTSLHVGKAVDEPSRSRSQILQFLHLIVISKPHLARYVKTIAIGDFSTWRSTQDPIFDTYGLTPDERSTYQNIIENVYPNTNDDYHLNARREWFEDLELGVEDAELCLLLASSPNLETLLFGEPYRPRNFYNLLYHSLITRDVLKSRIPLLQNLREVYHESKDRACGNFEYNIPATALLQLPKLKSYECVNPNGELRHGSLPAIPKRSSRVSEIVFRGGNVKPSELRNILKACSQLRSFEFIQANLLEDGPFVFPCDISNALLAHVRTLEHFHLNFEGVASDGNLRYYEPDYPDEIAMGTELRLFKALKTLVVGMQNLMVMEQDWNETEGHSTSEVGFLTEAFPPNLSHLEIHHCEISILPKIRRLLDVVASGEYFRNLTHLRLLFIAERVKDTNIDLICAKEGFKIEIILQSGEDRELDLVHSLYEGDFYVPNVCTRLYSDTSRQRWLKYRGGNLSQQVEGFLIVDPAECLSSPDSAI